MLAKIPVSSSFLFLCLLKKRAESVFFQPKIDHQPTIFKKSAMHFLTKRRFGKDTFP